MISAVTSFVLFIGAMSPYGWLENPAKQFDTLAACQEAGAVEKTRIPGTWEYEGHTLPLLDTHCESGSLIPGEVDHWRAWRPG